MIGATRAAIDALAAGETPTVWAPFPGPLEPAVIYDEMVWAAFEAEYAELVDRGECAS